MRPQQQNRRMRGRGGNNPRKSPNPLSRSFESNGPDVKIRGTAQQVADKYTTLARDAQSSGDRVMAENYLQHAEHYNRVVAAAQAQQQQQQQVGGRDSRDDNEDEGGREAAASNPENRNRRHRVEDGSGPQPDISGVPAELALKAHVPPAGGGNGHAEDTGTEVDPEGSPPKRSRKRSAAKPDETADNGAARKPARRTRGVSRRNDAAEGTPIAADGEKTSDDKDGAASDVNHSEEVTAQS